jgi:hypothetical protein
VTLPRDWKSLAILSGPDVAAAARRLPPYKPSEPVVTHLPPGDEPPAAEITLERILAVLQAAQQRSQQPEPATQPSTASQTDSQTRKAAPKRLQVSFALLYTYDKPHSQLPHRTDVANSKGGRASKEASPNQRSAQMFQAYVRLSSTPAAGPF